MSQNLGDIFNKNEQAGEDRDSREAGIRKAKRVLTFPADEVIDLAKEEDGPREHGSGSSGKRLRQTAAIGGRRIIASPDRSSVTTSKSASTIIPAESTAAAAAASSSSSAFTRAALDENQPPPLPQGVFDIDAKRASDASYVPVYAAEAYQYLRNLQFRYGKPSIRSIKERPRERAGLVDWMVRLTEEYSMSSDVLFLSVSILDRMFQIARFPPGELQLAASACLMLASKIEDVLTPSLDDFVQMNNDMYSPKDFIKMERIILTRLGYQLQTATTKQFMRRFQRAAVVTTYREKLMGNFLIELTLPHAYFLRFAPAAVAAAGVYLAKIIIPRIHVDVDNITAEREKMRKYVANLWTKELAHYTQYEVADLAHIISTLFNVLCRALEGETCCSNIVDKYSMEENESIAILHSPYWARDLLPEETARAIREGGW